MRQRNSLANYMLVFDVGKTHIKLHLLNENLQTISSQVMENHVNNCAPYPHYNIDAIWQWLLTGIKQAVTQTPISAISITTHGATAALINRHAKGSALVLPILDYEYNGINACNDAYNTKRGPFTETYSPDLPFGLNLGRQLHWQQTTYNDEFSKITDILLYPQYWAWRLSGVLCTEVSSLGCHTDLWSPFTNSFSSLVEKQKWRTLFPNIVPAWTNLGTVTKEIQTQTGLDESCSIFAGVHDSNASFLRYKKAYYQKPFTVISTGTWSIVMASGVSLKSLQPNRDMLANIDVKSEPIVCSRFMGGREFDTICQTTDAQLNDDITEKIVQQLINLNVMALPDFSNGSGPFPNHSGKILGLIPNKSGAALASLYCALMLDYQLDLVKAQGNIFIEGAFLKNAWICGILAQLREHQTIYLSADTTGTVQGCAQLVKWAETQPAPNTTICQPTTFKALKAYQSRWRSEVSEPSNIA